MLARCNRGEVRRERVEGERVEDASELPRKLLTAQRPASATISTRLSRLRQDRREVHQREVRRRQDRRGRHARNAQDTSPLQFNVERAIEWVSDAIKESRFWATAESNRVE
jgi:hypothetical protein